MITARQPRHRRRRWIRGLTVLAAGMLVLVAGMLVLVAGTGVPVLAATPGSVSPDGPSPRAVGTPAMAGRAPFGEYVDRLSFDVTAIDPALVTASGPGALTVTGTMTNAGPDELTDLSYRFQRAAALRTEADLRQELAAPAEPTARVQGDFTPLTPAVPAGGSAPFTFTVPITSGDGLAVDTPGVYPLMVNINGAVTLEGGPLDARIGELHLLLTVMSVPGSPISAGSTGPASDAVARPLPVNFVWPLVDRPHLGVGGVFLDEDLLGTIAPGGRLTTLVDGLLDPAADKPPDGSVTVVIDPQLLDELDRMTSDYRVVATPGDPQPAMTAMLQAAASLAATAPVAQTSTSPAGSSAAPTGTNPGAGAVTAPPVGTSGAGSSAPAPTNPPAPTTAAATDPGAADIPGTVPGTGQRSAASFLDRLRDVAGRYPVLVLPYGDPDVVALVRGGLVGEVSAAVEHGQQVTQRVLGADATPGAADAPRLDTGMAFPINGAADSATLAALRAAGLDSALLSKSSVELDGPALAAARVLLPAYTAAGTDSIPAAIAQPDVLNGVDALIDQGRQSGWAMRVNALTGVLARQSLESPSASPSDDPLTPAVFLPTRRWSPDAPGLRVLTDLLATLGASQVITGSPLPVLSASGTAAATATYPESAKSQELPQEYLARIRSSRVDVASLRQTLATTPQASNPELVLDPLDAALDAAASTAFRTDPAAGQANLATVEATTAGIRHGVEISSAGNSYTLASSTSPLVLTVQNNLPYDVPVRVEISGGERIGLTVSDPEVQVVPAGRSQQVKIPAEVSRSGQFQVSAQLVGADGAAWGPPVQLSVNSSAYGGLTVVIIIVAGGVLVLMVVLRIVQRVRGKGDTSPGLPSARDTPVGPRSGLREVIPGPGSTAEAPSARADQVGTDRP